MRIQTKDEIQVACRTKELAEEVIEVAQIAMRRTQEHYNVRCQLDTEGKIGATWLDCH